MTPGYGSGLEGRQARVLRVLRLDKEPECRRVTLDIVVRTTIRIFPKLQFCGQISCRFYVIKYQGHLFLLTSALVFPNYALASLTSYLVVPTSGLASHDPRSGADQRSCFDCVRS